MHVLANILRLRYNTPAVWTQWNGAHSRRFNFIAGMRSVWHCMQHVVGLADYHWALPCTTSVAIATQPVHRLQIRPIMHN